MFRLDNFSCFIFITYPEDLPGIFSMDLKTLAQFEEDPYFAKLSSKPTQFDASRHVRYYKMCNLLLPSRVEKEDSNRIALLYFTLFGLDMLRSLDKVIYLSEEQRLAVIEWIYSSYCGNGFRGSPTYDLHTELPYDPAHLPSTYFALCLLSMLRDTLMPTRIDRFAVMLYLRKCQLPDGLFTSTIDQNDQPFGEKDLRICLIASAIRKMLQVDCLPLELRSKYDIDVDALATHVRSCLRYNGAFGGDLAEEAHAGHTFCALATLRLLDNINDETIDCEFVNTILWLVNRQFWVDEYNKENFIQNENLSFEDLGGFNGRENKASDTCYAFWVIGSLKLLKREYLVHKEALEMYLLQGTQNLLVGGFGKAVGEMPDPLHSTLGLAALNLVGSAYLDVKPIEISLTIPSDSAEFLYSVKWP